MPGDAHPLKLVADPKVRRVSGVRVEGRLARELAVEDDIASVVDPALVDPNLQVDKPRNAARSRPMFRWRSSSDGASTFHMTMCLIICALVPF